MQRLSFFAGGSSLILHLGVAMFLVDHLRLPESVRPPVAVMVSLAPPFSSTALAPAQTVASLQPVEAAEPAAPNAPAAPSDAEPILAQSDAAPASAESIETPEAPASALSVPSALPEPPPAEARTPSEPVAAAIDDAPSRPPTPALPAESPVSPVAEAGTPLVQEASLPDPTPTGAARPRETRAAEAPVPLTETAPSTVPLPALAPRQGLDETPHHPPATAVVLAAPSAEPGDAADVRVGRIVTSDATSAPAATQASPPPASPAGAPTTSLAQQGTGTMPSLTETPPPLVEQPAAGEVTGAEAPPASVLPASRGLAEMAGFIDRYDGGSCFFVSAADMTKNGAEIESFSDSKERVDAFDAAFHAGIGLEANVTGQRVLKSQCPMVDFLKLERGNLAKAPILNLERRYLKDGDRLSGDIRGTGGRFVTLLLVSDKGMVQNLSGWLNDRGDAKAFSIPLRREQSGGKAPQILVAIASTAPLPDIGLAPVTEEGFFRALGEHAFLTRQGVQTAGKLFILTD